MRIDPDVARLAVAVDLHVGATAEVHRLRILDTFDLPRESFTQPRVGLFDLVAVFYALVEHPVLVADAVTGDGQAERRAAVQETGREPAEAAIPESRISLAVADVLEVESDPIQRRPGFFLDAEIQQRVAQQAPHEELEREVGYAPAVVGCGGVA